MPFSGEQFFGVFAAYNTAVWPVQWILVALALAMIGLAFSGRKWSDTAIAAGLALLWSWMAVAYHLIHFSTINRAAYIFAALFLLQGLLFAAAACRHRLTFTVTWNASGLVAGLFALYALAIYPLLGRWAGHVYPASPTFGAPCPTTIFTFAMLLATKERVPRHLIAVPILWAVVGSSAVFAFGIVEDLGLLIAGCVATVMLRRRRPGPGRPLFRP